MELAIVKWGLFGWAAGFAALGYLITHKKPNPTRRDMASVALCIVLFTVNAIGFLIAMRLQETGP